MTSTAAVRFSRGSSRVNPICWEGMCISSANPNSTFACTFVQTRNGPPLQRTFGGDTGQGRTVGHLADHRGNRDGLGDGVHDAEGAMVVGDSSEFAVLIAVDQLVEDG